MKPSMFNFIYKRSAYEYVGYNTFSKAIIVMNDHEHDIFVNNKFDLSNIDHIQMAQEFTKNGFLINDENNEIDFLKYHHYKTKFLNNNLTLTIAPTLDCNFACPYCYENPRKGSMNSEVQNMLLEYIKQKIDDGIKSIDITWYGGEPLLYPEVISNLSANISDLCSNSQVSLGMSLVTNGYLLTKDIVDMFISNNIKSIQITLDGLAENHDERRFLRNGGKTFDKIFYNIQLFRNTPIRVNVRMNVDKINCMDFLELKKKIEKIKDIEIGLYPSPVEKINERDILRNEYYMLSQDYDDFIITGLKENSISTNDLDVIDKRRYFCNAELENSYVVDELGNFYKCWDDIGNQNSICFNLYEKDKINYHQISKYVARDPFSDEKCKLCKFLPLCFGGCIFQKNNLNKPECNFNDENMRIYLENKHFTNKE